MSRCVCVCLVWKGLGLTTWWQNIGPFPTTASLLCTKMLLWRSPPLPTCKDENTIIYTCMCTLCIALWGFHLNIMWKHNGPSHDSLPNRKSREVYHLSTISHCPLDICRYLSSNAIEGIGRYWIPSLWWPLPFENTVIHTDVCKCFLIAWISSIHDHYQAFAGKQDLFHRD